jgi:hypothetical protein
MTSQMNSAVDSSLPAGPRSPLHLLVGRNSRGQWVVRERYARCGGLFSNRTEALRFAFRERGEAAGAVMLVPGLIELFEASPAGAPVGHPSHKPDATNERIVEEV